MQPTNNPTYITMDGILTKSTKLQRVQKKYLLTTEGINAPRANKDTKIQSKVTTQNLHKTYSSKADVQQKDKPVATSRVVHRWGQQDNSTVQVSGPACSLFYVLALKYIQRFKV